MGMVKRIYVEKKASFAVKARELEEELKGYLGIDGLEQVRILSVMMWRICRMLCLRKLAKVFCGAASG